MRKKAKSFNGWKVRFAMIRSRLHVTLNVPPVYALDDRSKRKVWGEEWNFYLASNNICLQIYSVLETKRKVVIQLLLLLRLPQEKVKKEEQHKHIANNIELRALSKLSRKLISKQKLFVAAEYFISFRTHRTQKAVNFISHFLSSLFLPFSPPSLQLLPFHFLFAFELHPPAEQANKFKNAKTRKEQ